MTNPVFTGYLEDPYLEHPPDYLGGTGQDFFGMQVNRVITDDAPLGMQVARFIEDFPAAKGMQVARFIKADEAFGAQVTRIIANEPDKGMQVARFIEDFPAAQGMQVARQIGGTQKTLGMQARLVITDDQTKGMQTRRIIRAEPEAGVQVNRSILGSSKPVGMEIRRSASFPHINCAEGGYLAEPYLTGPYLTEHYCVHGPMQVRRVITADKEAGLQVNRHITTDKEVGMQTRRIIKDHLAQYAMQVRRFFTSNTGMQILRVLYNVTQLRVMVEFPSRGRSTTGGTNAWGNPIGTGQNWTATSTAPGNFSVFNLNTDIVEQRWQSGPGDTNVTLACDTEVVQGVSIDTISFQDHNLTTSAVVTLESSTDSGFSPVNQSIPLAIQSPNLYYIAPTFPTQQYRYRRFVITDPTNPDGYIRIGSILFGTTVILQGECFTDEVRRRKKHFVNRLPTEGFTNASNDRALKRAISLEFRNLVYGRGNYNNLVTVFDFVRTSLKALWIPDPRDSTRFAVFGKMMSMPDELHRNMGRDTEADTVSFQLEIDESL